MLGKIIIISVAVFAIITLVLVWMLLFARKKLLPQGNVKMIINDKKEFEVSPGNTVLSTLAENRIYLPSACGGGGTCGLCKCQILEGAGEVLPTEKPHLTRQQQMNSYHLGCQTKVRSDIKLVIPDEIFGIRKWECEVISNNSVATYIKEFVVKLPEREKLDFRSGGYIQIDVPKCRVDYKDFVIGEEYRDEWTQNKMWDLKMKNNEPVFRAYSMANYPAEGNIIMLNIRIATPPFNRTKQTFEKVNPGICSSYIWSLKAGNKITISGPYGEFFVKNNDKEMMFIGGGAGMAPMRSQILDQFLTKKTKRKASFWYGGRSLRELFYVEDFQKIEKDNPNFSFHIALSDPKKEDNWTGDTGFIHNVIYEKYLKTHPAPEDIEYYLCGPKLMTDAAVNMLENLGVERENIMFDDFGN